MEKAGRRTFGRGMFKNFFQENSGFQGEREMGRYCSKDKMVPFMHSDRSGDLMYNSVNMVTSIILYT